MDAEDGTRELARRAIAAGSPTTWFEQLYTAAASGTAVVPWDREAANRLFVDGGPSRLVRAVRVASGVA